MLNYIKSLFRPPSYTPKAAITCAQYKMLEVITHDFKGRQKDLISICPIINDRTTYFMVYYWSIN